MPLFEFVCKKCGNKFEKIVFSINNEEIKCPSCDSSDVEKQFSTFSSASSSSSGCSNRGSRDCVSKQQHHCCNGCCHH